MKRIRINTPGAKTVHVETDAGKYTVQIVSTRHGWSDADPTTYCIAAIPVMTGSTCRLSGDRSSRKEIMADWENGFELQASPEPLTPILSAIVGSLIASGSAEYV